MQRHTALAAYAGVRLERGRGDHARRPACSIAGPEGGTGRCCRGGGAGCAAAGDPAGTHLPHGLACAGWQVRRTGARAGWLALRQGCKGRRTLPLPAGACRPAERRNRRSCLSSPQLPSALAGARDATEGWLQAAPRATGQGGTLPAARPVPTWHAIKRCQSRHRITNAGWLGRWSSIDRASSRLHPGTGGTEQGGTLPAASWLPAVRWGRAADPGELDWQLDSLNQQPTN